MEIYYGTKRKTVYYVYPKDYDKAQAIDETARSRKYSKAKLKVITVWVKGDDLYLENVAGAKMMVAVVNAV